MSPERVHDLAKALLLATLMSLGIGLGGVVQCGLVPHGEGACGKPLLSGLLANISLFLTMMSLVALSHPWLPRGRWRRAGLALQVLGVAVLSLVLPWFAHKTKPQFSGEIGLQTHQVFLTLAACIAISYDAMKRARRESEQAEALDLQGQTLERDLHQARLQLLQAQVEPHFLFNTLAHLRRLAQTDAAGARAMLADLLRYLGEALPSLRDEVTTLGRELELVRAYLALHQLRMGPERLRLHYEVPSELFEHRLPSTCLLTLAENAIKHGIAPLVGGGEIRVRAWIEQQSLFLELADTGRGMGAGSGQGTGLATLRAQLKALFGEGAELMLAMNQPQGLIARLRLPA